MSYLTAALIFYAVIVTLQAVLSRRALTKKRREIESAEERGIPLHLRQNTRIISKLDRIERETASEVRRAQKAVDDAEAERDTYRKQFFVSEARADKLARRLSFYGVRNVGNL